MAIEKHEYDLVMQEEQKVKNFRNAEFLRSTEIIQHWGFARRQDLCDAFVTININF